MTYTKSLIRAAKLIETLEHRRLLRERFEDRMILQVVSQHVNAGGKIDDETAVRIVEEVMARC